jgi:hypothetical protein
MCLDSDEINLNLEIFVSIWAFVSLAETNLGFR